MACALGVSAQAPSSREAQEIQRLLKDGQPGSALKLIDEALARQSQDPQMRFRRGVALSMLDRKAEALAVFQKLTEDHPEMPAPYNNMAVILGSQGDYDKARQALERAIRTHPAYATAYQNLGDVYAQLASQAYTKALSLDKADASVPPKLALLRELTSGAQPPATPTAAPVPAASPTPAVVAKAPTAAVSPAVPPTSPAAAPTRPASSAAVPPATAPAPAAAPVAAAPTAKPAPSSPAVDASADVQAAVRAWAAAWARRDMAAYFAAYSPEFRGAARSRSAWEQDRRDRIATRKHIKVDVQDLRVTVDGDRATARFRQIYSSDALSASGRKTLQLVRGPQGRWVIREESVSQ